jgi:hypothetical protein
MADFAERCLPPRSQPKILTVFEVYADESGTEEVWCAVAGFKALTTNWRPFEEAWSRVLHDAGADYFHSKEFFQGGKPFGQWSGEKRIRFIDDLIQLIDEWEGLSLAASAVDTKAFFARNEQERIYLTGGRWHRGKWRFPGAPTKPYYLPFAHVFDKFHKGIERVNMFHDQHSVYAEHALRLHAHAKLHRKPPEFRQGIGTLTFGSKTEFVPLQAADLAAYLTFCRVAYGKAAPDTELGHVAQVFQQRFGNLILTFDERTIESHLRRTVPIAIREGRMPSQQRVERRRVKGREKQREKQRQRPKR